MADKFVRFPIDADIWRRFRIVALQREMTAGALLANVVTDTVKEAEGGTEHQGRDHTRSRRARDKT